MQSAKRRYKRYLISILPCLVTVVIALVACSEETSSITVDSLPPGNATRGEAIFAESINGSPPCSACHIDRSIPAGPTLGNYRKEVEDRRDTAADEYTLDAIVRPARHILRGYSNTMYARYGEKLSAQDIADLMAYMLD